MIVKVEPLPPRTPWSDFPRVVIHAPEVDVKKHPSYAAAKAGDAGSAFSLVADTLSEEAVQEIVAVVGDRSPFLVSAHAYERNGVNAIPEALASELSERTGFEVDSSIVQTNIVGHTGANGFARMARQAAFDGEVVAGADYWLVDDFIGQGGTLANLRGFLESKGGHVIGATALTGKPHSAKLAPTAERIAALRAKHGNELEVWWKTRFGHDFDCLTESEARYLEQTADADTVRNRIAEAE